jgi:bifunctional DNA-binding transcriptional regulator/antitoxin component of YhaV-PrlF toxin-antitoxin module
MSATAVKEQGQATLPADVLKAAGLKAGDQVDWRFEEGEIRGRKVATESRIVGKLVRKNGALVCEADGFQVDPQDIARAVREERDR